MVANTKGMKRKSLAPQNTSPKKTPKVTSVSATNTPAKLQKLSSPIKKNIPAKAKNVMKQSNKGVAKQKKAPPKKVEQSDDDDEDEEEEMSDDEELEMEEDSDMEDADSIGVEEEEDSVDGEEDSDNANDIGTGDNPDDDDDDDESDSNDVEEKPIVKIDKNKKPNNDQKKPSTWERVSKDDEFVVFVGHLNFKTSEDEVRQHFRKAGVVEGVNLAKFRNNVSRGFGFIQMKDEAGFKKALKLNHTTLGGMQINVEVAKKSSLKKTDTKPKVRPRKNKKPAEA